MTNQEVKAEVSVDVNTSLHRTGEGGGEVVIAIIIMKQVYKVP